MKQKITENEENLFLEDISPGADSDLKWRFAAGSIMTQHQILAW